MFTLSIVAAVAVMVTGDLWFREYDRYIVAPITQAVAFFIATMIGWFGWDRHLPDRYVNTAGALASTLAIVTLIALVRIAYRLG